MKFFRKPRCQAKGFTIIEVMFALMIFMAMVLMVASVIPITAQAVRYSTDFNQAQTVVMKKIAQIQEAGYNNMTGPLLGQNGLDVVDGTPTTPASNSNGDQTGSLEFTVTDNIWRFFPGGTTTAGAQDTSSLTRPRGFIFFAPYTASAISGTSPTVYGTIRVTVVVQWWGWGSRGRMHSYSASTLVSRTPIL